MRRATGFALLLLAGLAPAAGAQSLGEIDKRDGAVIEAWTAAPLSVRRAVFVSEPPKGFGEYVERPDSVFKKGEKLVTYAEPVGYGWKELGGGLYEFGLKVDFVIKTPEGKVLGGQEDFADLSQKSHARNREFMLTLTLSVTGAPAGDYVLVYKLRDVTSSKTTTFSQPFKIVD